jgi:DNA-binding response OmpR family regulator
MIGDLLLLKDKSVLFAEDDKVARVQMAEVLSMIFGVVFSAKDGEEAYRMYEDEKPNLIITDIKMPKMDGLKLARQIRRSDYDTPIIMLTSFAEQDLLLSAANLSIDGYLVKPVELGGIVDTICKAIKRTNRDAGFIKLSANIFYHSGTKELYQNGAPISLGAKEQELLLLLMNNRTKTVSKDEIARELWPFDPICESAVKNLVLRMRKKLGGDLIVSVRGIGYRLNINGAQLPFGSEPTLQRG